MSVKIKEIKGLQKLPNNFEIQGTLWKAGYLACDKEYGEGSLELSEGKLDSLLMELFPQSYRDDGEFQITTNFGVPVDGNKIIQALQANLSKILICTAKGEKMSDESKCKDDWHLGWKGLVEKYGEEEAEKRYKPYRSCPSQCGAKVDYGD